MIEVSVNKSSNDFAFKFLEINSCHKVINLRDRRGTPIVSAAVLLFELNS